MEYQHLQKYFGRKAKLRPKDQGGARGSGFDRLPVPLNKTLHDYGTKEPPQEMLDSCSWLLRREIPTSREILGYDNEVKPAAGARDEIGTEVEIPINIVDQPWDSKADYIGAHYQLLREDTVAPLRDAVDELRAEPSTLDNERVCVYENVRITGLTFSPQGPAAKVTFTAARAGKRIAWSQSKRLVQGGIVALTPASDMFQTKCIVATIAARPLSGVEERSEVDIFFADPAEIEIDPQEEFVMVESRTGYFEATRHTLRALQLLMTERMPFEDHLVSLKPEVGIANYRAAKPTANLSAIFTAPKGDHHLENIDINADEGIGRHPRPPRNRQEPPNHLDRLARANLQVGKTHVSVVALKALIANTTIHDPPIVVAAQTNHALDQLLRHISHFEPNFIRLGGRTTDQEIVGKRTLFEIRNKLANVPKVSGCQRGATLKQLKKFEEYMINVLAPLHGAKGPFSAQTLCENNILTRHQLESLERGAAEWVRSSDSNRPSGSMAAWLADDLVAFNSTKRFLNIASYEYEEPDLEMEELEELEAEAKGVPRSDDEELDSVRGRWHPLNEPWTGRHDDALTSAVIKRISETQDLWMVPVQYRGSVYCLYQRQLKQKITQAIRNLSVFYMEAAHRLKMGKWQTDSAIIKQEARVIGMTTTGLSKYRGLVASLLPRTILIEEAAETMESFVMASCFESVEQLILVGDHQQLRAHCSLHDLESSPFNLGISMFERLVTNGVEFSSLNKQRRMIPEIRQNLMSIYPNLEDHESVLDHLPVPGMGGVNSYFFSHNWAEGTDDHASKFNPQEAEFIAGFYNYLIGNGMHGHQITILTFYHGQRKAILRSLRSIPGLIGQLFNVFTVDSYQGEENEVVLLSLVRSNPKGVIGFLGDPHRACVALSRARRGFYVFGNSFQIGKASPTWAKVLLAMLKDPQRLGPFLPLTCKHDKIIPAQSVFDLIDPQGGKGKLKAWNGFSKTAEAEEKARVELERQRLLDEQQAELLFGEPKPDSKAGSETNNSTVSSGQTSPKSPKSPESNASRRIHKEMFSPAKAREPAHIEVASLLD
ncbi:MAG: hypothetical protein M1829_005842 [Trizodia sp. TS-e1964]|nr:MAG: hypothetical protein M1829_005842 [Trizodia sp. TS-e1964]